MTDILSLNADGTLHVSSGKFSQSLSGQNVVNYSRESKEAMEAVAKHIEENAAKIGADSKLKKAIDAAAPQLESLAGPKNEVISKLKAALNFSAAKTVDATTADLISNPLARKFLDDKALHRMGIDDVSQLDELIKSKTKLADLAKDVTANKDSIRGVFIQHHGASPEVIEALVGSKTNVKAIAAGVSKNIVDDLRSVTTQAGKIDTLDKQILNAEAKGLKTTVFEGQRKAAFDRIKEITSGKDHAGKVFEALEKQSPDLHSTVKTELASHMEQAVKSSSKVAKTGGIFTKSSEELAKLGELKGISGFWKRRTGLGKAGIIAGAAAVTYAIVSAVGGKGPGENAERVNQGREGEPAVGRA